MGSTGSMGSIGLLGSTGSVDSMGSIGLMGSTGSMGSIGSMGSTGSMGSIGSMGSTGSMGLTGSMGSTVQQQVQWVQQMHFCCNRSGPVWLLMWYSAQPKSHKVAALEHELSWRFHYMISCKHSPGRGRACYLLLLLCIVSDRTNTLFYQGGAVLDNV